MSVWNADTVTPPTPAWERWPAPDSKTTEDPGGRQGVIVAERNNLKIYWTRGEGALKIRWGTPGDFTRCVRELDEHVGPERARRICAQWHFEQNGFWPGSRQNR